MKKIALGLAAALAVSLSATAEAASDGVRATLFDADIVMNGRPVQLLRNNPLLNYNGRVYVPVRQISEVNEAAVGYDAESRTVYIDQPSIGDGKSAVHAEAKDDTFTLRLFAGKTEYAEGEPIKVWARLTREQDEAVTVYHGEPLIRFNIADGEGFEDRQLLGFSLATDVFNPGNEYNARVSAYHLFSYNAAKHNFSWETYQNEAKRPGVLPPGDYTITAIADYSLDKAFSPDSKRVTKASIDIKVK